MPSLRDIRKRIASVKNTQQITKAMKMVSAAKLRGAEDRLKKNRPYARKLDELIADLYIRTDAEGFELLKQREEVKSIEVIVVSSDRGLCGALNSNLFRSTVRFLEELKAQGKNVRLSIVGRKGRDYFKRRSYEIAKTLTNVLKEANYEVARELGEESIKHYEDGEVDEVYVAYNEYRSAISQKATFKRLVPVAVPDLEKPEGLESKVDFRYEPSRAEILNELLPKQVKQQIFRAFLDNVTSEHGARMSSMDSATTNAGEMIGKLTLKMNRARQASITSELMDIINGAESQH